MDKTEQEREAAIVRALSDSSSEYYKHMCVLLDQASAMDAAARASSAYVTIPFQVSDSDMTALESQFSVVLKKKGTMMRSRNTERVAALLFVLDAALMEHAGSGGRSVMLVDGDILSVAAVGSEGRIVERSNCHSRAAYGYFQEDEHLLRSTHSKNSAFAARANVLLEQVNAGGGENFSVSVRSDGPRVDSLIINHFKTPVGLIQAAWLTACRGGVCYGAFPFQLDMRYKDEGELLCFPGHYYVDHENDVITLVPQSDATMTVSHCYSHLMEFVDNNSVKVAGKEFLCEKYMSVSGILYYTIVPVDKEYEAPETLRTHYYDVQAASLVELSFPKVKLSDAGVPVGFERGKVRMLNSRLTKVMGRVAMSKSELIRPAEVFSALMDYNNMIVNTLDTAVVAERMDVTDEEDAALAIALLMNWRRHAARGTLNTLLNAVKLRHSVKDINIMGFASLALSAWWHKPSVSKEVQDHIPYPKVVDWCGNDFSVLIQNVDPWVEIESSTQVLDESVSFQVPWFPLVPVRGTGWVRAVEGMLDLKRKRSLDLLSGTESVEVVKRKLDPISFQKMVQSSSLVPTATLTPVVASEVHIVRNSDRELTTLKRKLYDKMVQEQGAINEQHPGNTQRAVETFVPETIPVVPVVEVDVVSAMRNDMNEIVGGLPELDGPSLGYRLAEVEIDKVTQGNIEINDSKRNLPKARYVRRPKVDLGVEGNRVQSAAGLLGAVFKRNIGIPNNRGVVNLDLTPDLIVRQVIAACFKDGWQEVVEKHISSGMWEPNEADIEDYLHGVDEMKAKKMMDEFFLEGFVELDRWKMMAKGKIKSSREEGTDTQIPHSQTICFLESSSTNAMYSSILRRVNECLTECLRENVRVNPQCGAEDNENWYNSIEPLRRSVGVTYSYSSDSKAYDRSQEHPCMLFEAALFRVLGFNGARFEIWCKEWGLKRAMNVAFGIVFSGVWTGLSGDWKTIFRNGWIQLAANIVSGGIQRRDIITLEIKGDDMDGEFSRPLAVETAVERMSLGFNLASKFNTNSVRYFCKNFRLKVLGRWVEVADPWARAQSLCTPVWMDRCDIDMTEKWVSLCADLRHYDNEVVLTAVAEATQQYYGLKIAPYGLCRALAMIKADKNKYMGFFEAPVMVS